jgi:hypothetical protein
MIFTSGDQIFHISAMMPTHISSGTTLVRFIKGFSSGCLGGNWRKKAILDAVPHFRTSFQHNEKRILVALGMLLSIIFCAVTVMTLAFGISCFINGHPKIIAEISFIILKLQQCSF